jgi:quercetin dioxygenase-like cupin family protein
MSILLDKIEAAANDASTTAERQVLLDDDQSRITQWRFPPGTQTGWHRHTHDYVTVQQSQGCLRLENADGSEKIVEYEDGRAVAYTAPIEHNATNISDVIVQVLEIEFK